jgi:CheY-like chemotaxis protein
MVSRDGGGTALVADDHEVIRSSLAEVLAEFDLNVLQAASGFEAREKVSAGSVDVVVLDINMPGDGIETAALLQREHPDLIVIFLTAFDTRDNRRRAAELRVQVEAWVDKDPDWIQRVARTVLVALKRRAEAALPERLRIMAADLGMPAEHTRELRTQLEAGLREIRTVTTQLARLEHPTTSDLQRPSAEQQPARSFSVEELYAEISLALYETRSAYTDAADREIHWERLRGLVNGPLWDVIERTHFESHRKQLVDQLGAALCKLESHQVEIVHLDAVALTLERLRSQKIGPGDVDDCERTWRVTNVDTLPSFDKLLTEWQELYGFDEDSEEDPAGDDRTAATDRGRSE